jgi:ATP-binding cassette subfamily B protein
MTAYKTLGRQAEFRAMALVTGVFTIGATNSDVDIVFGARHPLSTMDCRSACSVRQVPAFIAQGRYSRLFFRLLTRRAPEFRQ